ncbi:MAG: gliding motility-associated ABC transporter substrate-binding protein GldG [Cytophagales bacterium]|nr:gliding motility-associated ABC transporter substrate-binding protein GldG [Cytophagales bacterium]
MKGKKRDIVLYIVGLLVILLVNWVVGKSFMRFDLTEDKRFSLASSTKSIVSTLDSPLRVQVYLHGDFPAGFKNLERSIEETLEEMSAYAGKNLKYEFIDPYKKETDKKKRGEFFKSLVQLGLQPTSVVSNEGGSNKNTLVFPGAVLVYKGRKIAVPFLKGNREDDLYQSMETVEFELVSGIKVLKQERKKRVAFVEGHGELADAEVFQAMNALSLQYEVGRMNLSLPDKIENLEALIIAQPKQAYTEQEKYKLDQYLMNGGKVLFFMDAIETRKDSVGLQGLPYDLNLRDLLFRYGVRVNMNMIQDLNASPVPIRDGQKYKLLPWSFYPLLNEFNKEHPIVKNMNALLTRHINTLDTIKAKGVKKTPLVYTSKYTKVKSQPIVYSAEELRINLDKNYYNSGQLPVSYLLEGNFTSLYAGRPLPDSLSFEATKVFLSKGNGKGKVLVFSDGDILANAFDQKAGKPYPLGFDQYTREVYSNKQFLLNAINYMLDEEVVRQSFNKNIVKRPLDKFKVEEEKTKWQIINVVVPVLLVVLFGIVRWWIRKRKYASFG